MASRLSLLLPPLLVLVALARSPAPALTPGASATAAFTADAVEATRAFLDSLDHPLRTQAREPLDSSEWHVWTNTPDDGRRGVRYGELNEAQTQAADALLAVLVSERGLQKVRGIMRADDQLQGRSFGADKYWFLVFGEPSQEQPWGIQFEGHHLILNFLFQGDRVCISPSFVGIQPAVYQDRDRRVEPLAAEVNRAFDLLESLTPEQRERVVVSAERGQLAAGAGADGVAPKVAGLPARDLDPDQRARLRDLIHEWLALVPPALAARRITEVDAELDEVRFSWSGPTARDRAVAYRIQGPTLLIEFAHQGRMGRRGNGGEAAASSLDHIHTVYRDLGNDYGVRFRAH